MADKQRLIFPFGGISDGDPFSSQPMATSRDAVNVRGIDPATGRARGGQRSGMTKFMTTQLAGAPIRDLNSVSFHVPRVDYAPLGNSPTVEWSVDTPLKNTVKNIEVDWQGNLYVLDGTHRIIRYNPHGERTAALSLQGNDGFEAIGAPAVDFAGNIYVGMRSLDGGSQGKVLRFAPDNDPDDREDSRWDIIYDYPLPAGLVKLRYSYGILYALTKNVSEEKSNLIALGFADSTLPSELWTKSLPYPTNDYDFDSTDGNIFVACGPNTERGGAIPNQGSKSIIWVPHELGNRADPNGTPSDSKLRLHAWLDARYVGDTSQDGELLLWPDRRFAVSAPVSDDWDQPVDDYERNAYAVADTENVFWRPPTWSAYDFGGSPCVQFDGGQAIVTEPNTSPEPRASVTGGWTGNAQGAIIPGYSTDNEATTENGTGFGFATLFRVRDTGAMRVVYSQHGNGAYFAVIANASFKASTSPDPGGGFNPATIQHAPGRVAVLYTGWWLGPAGSEQRRTVVEGEIGADGVCCVSVLFHRDRTGTETTFPHWTVRINGVQRNTGSTVSQNLGPTFSVGETTTVKRNDIWGPQSWTTIGAPTAFQDSDLQETHWPSEFPLGDTMGNHGFVVNPAELHPFIGDIAEVISWLPKLDNNAVAAWDGWGDPGLTLAQVGSYGGEYPHLLGNDTGVDDYVDGNGFCSNHSGVNDFHATDLEKIEGYLMNKQGLQSYLGQFAASADNSGNTDAASAAVPLYKDHLFVSHAPATDGGGGSGTWDLDIDANQVALAKKGPILMKLEPSGGDLVWALNDSGIGFAVRTNSEGDVFCHGPAWNAATDVAWDYSGTETSALPALVRKVEDLGTTYTLTGASWVYSPTGAEGGGDPASTYQSTYETPQVAVDTADNFYVVFNNASITTDVLVFRSTKNSVGTNQFELNWAFGLNSSHSSDMDVSQKPFAIALPPESPAWPESRAEEDRQPEFIYLGTDRGTEAGGDKALHKLRITSATVQDSGSYSPRVTVYTAVCNGKLWRYKKDNGGTFASPGSDVPKNPERLPDEDWATDTLFRPASPYVMSTALREKLYLVDGGNYTYVYDPKPLLGGWSASPQRDTVQILVSKTAGEVPSRAKLIANWRGRLVMARTADSAHNWYMSAIGDPENWDYFPRLLRPDQAVSGGVSSVGLSPDIINTIIPYNDDLLIFGCDSSIVRLTGDPMLGGQMDLITNSVGMAFGKSWCKDPEGAIYFFGSVGGVYRMGPTGDMAKISEGRIGRRLLDVDLETYTVRLVWNHRDIGLHVILSPYGTSGADVAHYFWERPNAAWYEDRFSNYTSHHPFSLAVVDGDDANDRRLLVGTVDGFVRYWNMDSKDDDSSKIDSNVLLGPLMVPDNPGISGRWTRFEAMLGDSLDGCRVELLASESPEVLGDVVAQGDLVAGQNEILPIRARGAAVWMRLRNNLAGQSWAMEFLQMTLQGTNRKRIRS